MTPPVDDQASAAGSPDGTDGPARSAGPGTWSAGLRPALPAPDRPGEPSDFDETNGPEEPPAPNGPPDEPLSPGSEPDEPLFLGDGSAGIEGLWAAANRVVEAVERWAAGGPTAGPCPDLPPDEPGALDETSRPDDPPPPSGQPNEPLPPGGEPDEPLVLGDGPEGVEGLRAAADRVVGAVEWWAAGGPTAGPCPDLPPDEPGALGETSRPDDPPPPSGQPGKPDEPLFLGDGAAGVEGLRAAANRVVEAVERWAAGGPGAGPCPDLPPDELAALVAGLDPCPDEAVPLDRVLDEIGERVLAHGVRPWHPWCAAHLQCPPLLTAAATELAIGATNQSMDSYDQAPAATLVEDRLVGRLAEILGLPAGATGVMTAGGTASNLLGFILAREHAGHARGDGRRDAGSVADSGLPDDADRWRIVASAAAHFSVEQAAAVLGLGRRAVATVDVDDHGRMDVDALDATLARLDGEGHTTIAVVGTAGTTDAGAIDPLDALADRAAARSAWFHVDAAVGGALCLSDRLRPLVAGLGRADSVTTDLHKLWFQPIGASALLVRDPGAFDGLHRPSDYLDRAEDGELGVLNLVRRSLDTSRRFDALKVLVSLRSTGRRRMAALVEHLVDTAAATAEVIDRHPDLELLAPPSTVTVLFRWRPARPSARRLAAAHPAGPAAAQATRPEASVLDAATPTGTQAAAPMLDAAATGPDEAELDATQTGRPDATVPDAATPTGTRAAASVLDAAATGPDEVELDAAQASGPDATVPEAAQTGEPAAIAPDPAQAGEPDAAVLGGAATGPAKAMLGAAQAGGPDASASGGAATGPDEVMLDAVNTAVQRRLFAAGRAVLGRTRWRGRVALKVTVVNPRTSVGDLARLADLVAVEGAAVPHDPEASLEVVR